MTSPKGGKSKKSKSGKAAAKADDNDEDDEALASLKKPRIKISLKDGGGKKKASKPKKKSGKKAGAADVEDDEGNHGDDEKTTATKRKRKRADKEGPSKKISRKRTKKSEVASKPEVAKESPVKAENDKVAVAEPAADVASAVYLDVDLLKAERESLDGSFQAARAHFTERGPWKLPAAVGESKFRSVAKQTLMKMGR